MLTNTLHCTYIWLLDCYKRCQTFTVWLDSAKKKKLTELVKNKLPSNGTRSPVSEGKVLWMTHPTTPCTPDSEFPSLYTTVLEGCFMKRCCSVTYSVGPLTRLQHVTHWQRDRLEYPHPCERQLTLKHHFSAPCNQNTPADERHSPLGCLTFVK